MRDRLSRGKRVWWGSSGLSWKGVAQIPRIAPAKLLRGNGSNRLSGTGGKNVETELSQCGTVNFRKTHLQQDFTRQRRRYFHHACDLRRGALDHLQNLIRNNR